MMLKQDYVDALIPKKRPEHTETSAFAPANIAMCKYWGKSNLELNLPTTPSISISLGKRGSQVNLKLAPENSLIINQKAIDAHAPEFRRTFDFVKLLAPNVQLKIQTSNNIPTAAGLASSASYFAALTLALNQLYNWQAPLSTLSCLARLGSGSACRSLFHGFVKWLSVEDPLQSYGMPMAVKWPELRIGLLIFNAEPKAISSRQAMAHTQATSPFYQAWCQNAHLDFKLLRKAVEQKDFKTLGQISEANALALHAVMLASRPAVIYSQPETLRAINLVHQLRREGVEVYFTQDAGPNLKLLFQAKDLGAVQHAFPGVDIVEPFA